MRRIAYWPFDPLSRARYDEQQPRVLLVLTWNGVHITGCMGRSWLSSHWHARPGKASAVCRNGASRLEQPRPQTASSLSLQVEGSRPPHFKLRVLVRRTTSIASSPTPRPVQRMWLPGPLASSALRLRELLPQHNARSTFTHPFV